MKLPFLPKFAKKNAFSYFLVLVLRDEKVNAVIFEELGGKIRTVGQQEEYFQDSIDKASLDELLDILDKAISKAEESLPLNIETQKTILGVKADWTEDNRIKKDQLEKLKNISSKLGLTPIGFLVIPEAISHFLQKEEGAPVSAILAEIGKKFVTVSLIKGGKIIETKNSEIHESLPYTVDFLLKHFAISEILPSRIIIFNGAEDLSQEFISHQWSKSLPFLHLPQIVNLPSGFDAKAVLFGAATQMGLEVLEKNIPQPILPKKETPPSFSSDFGFIEDDVVKISTAPPSFKIEREGNAFEKQIQKKTNYQNPYSKLYSFIIFSKSALSNMLSIVKKINIKKIIPKSIIPSRGKGTLVVIIPLLMIIIFFLVYIFGTFAKVILTIKPKVINQNESIIFSSSPTKDSSNTIASEFESLSYDGTVSKSSTGKKEVGDKAKGTVTIFNNSDVTKTLQQGTTITSSNNLDYTLIDSVTIASASGDLFIGTTPGKANVNVTSSKIGTEYNLPSNTKFSIGNNLLIAAKNDNPFSGGTKKEITVVSKEDEDKLLAQLPKNLEQKAMEEFTKKLPNEKTLLPIFIDKSVTKKNFDKNIEDQSNEVTLTGTVTYEGLSYRKNDLITLAKNLIKKDAPRDLVINEGNIKLNVKNVKKKNDKEVSADFEVRALLLPNINTYDLAKQIKGMSIKDANDILLKIPDASRVNISIFPNIPFFKNNLPKLYKHIKILTNNND